MSNYALIKGNQVANLIVADPEFARTLVGEYDYVVPTGTAGIGFIYDPETGSFIDPNPAPATTEEDAPVEEVVEEIPAEETPAE